VRLEVRNCDVICTVSSNVKSELVKLLVDVIEKSVSPECILSVDVLIAFFKLKLLKVCFSVHFCCSYTKGNQQYKYCTFQLSQLHSSAHLVL